MVVSVVVVDLECVCCEFVKEWRMWEMEYEVMVCDLECWVSSLNARLAATSDDVERAFECVLVRWYLMLLLMMKLLLLKMVLL